jgi:sortase A
VRFVFVEGAGAASLRRGPGHYPGTSLPGEAGTTAIAGHRTTYLAPFRHLDDLRRGDRIAIRMPYGRFTYRVERTRIVRPDQTEVLRDVRGAQRLVLTSCNPIYSDAQRLVVFARLDRARRA